MRRIIILSVFLVCLFSSQAHSAIPLLENDHSWQAQLFLADNIKGIGLVDSYQQDGVNKSYTYDNVLAAMAFMQTGNFGLAEEILDTLCNEVKVNSKGAPYESYIYSDPSGLGSGTVYAGNAAWFLQALNIYQKLKSTTKYYVTQKKLADFLVSLQDSSNGGIRGSSTDYWKSTEHNLISYVALQNFSKLNKLNSYSKKAAKIKKFLKSSQIWDGERFYRGEDDPTEVVDVQSLGVLVLGKSYSSALDWAEQNLKAYKSYNTYIVTGFDFDANLDTVWLEGTLQAALAFNKIGNASKYNFFISEAEKTLQNNGSELLATNQGTAGEYWILEPCQAVAPTAWLIFTYQKFNPLVQY